MPTVPLSSGPSVQATVSPVTRPTALSYQRAPGVNADAFGAQVAQAQERSGRQLQQVGDDLSRLALKEQAEDNEREAKRLSVEFDDARRKITFGDGTPENPGYYAAQGEDAIAARGKAEEALRKEKQRIAALAANPRAAEMFGAQADVDLSNELDSMSRHAAKQRQVANDLTSQARVQSAADDVARKWNDEEATKIGLAKITGEVTATGDRNGWSDEVVAAKLREAYTVAIKGRFDAAMAAENSVEASKIIESHGQRVDSAVLSDMRKTLRTQGLAKAAEMISDEAMQLYPDDPAKQRQHIIDKADAETELKALSRLGVIVGAEKADRAEQRAIESHAMAKANNQRSRDEAARREAEREAKALFYREVWNGKPLADVARENPDAFTLVSGDGPTMSGLQTAEAQFAKRQQFGAVTDGKSLNELRGLPVNELAEINLQEYQHRLTPAEYEKASVLQASARKRLESVQSNQAIFAQGEGLLKDFAPTSLKKKWDTVKAGEEGNTARQAAINEMNAFIATFTDRGTLPSREEMAKEAVRLMLTLKADPAGFMDAGDRSFSGIVANADRMSPQQRAVAEVPLDKIPQGFLADIEADARATGTTLTDSLRGQLAAARALGDVERYKRLLGR